MTREEFDNAITTLQGDNAHDHSAVIDFLERFGSDAIV